MILVKTWLDILKLPDDLGNSNENIVRKLDKDTIELKLIHISNKRLVCHCIIDFRNKRIIETMGDRECSCSGEYYDGVFSPGRLDYDKLRKP